MSDTTHDPRRGQAVKGRAIRFEASDGRSLGGTFFEAPEPKAALVIHGATAVHHAFYGRFAAYAASRGFSTLTYDFRGIGESLAGRLRDERAVMHEWGTLDMSAATRFAASLAPGRPLFAMGHSVGGQLAGLVPEHRSVRGYAFVCASTGVFWRMPAWYGAFTASLWYGLFPAFRATLGRVPMSWFGMGEDLPAGVAKEWGRWCTSTDYYGRALDHDGVPRFHDAIRAPIASYAFTDDPIANERTVNQLLAYYRNATIHRHHLSPKELGRAAIGHMGFFRAANAEVLWDRPLDRFVDLIETATPSGG